jgi:hypothetical protein
MLQKKIVKLIGIVVVHLFLLVIFVNYIFKESNYEDSLYIKSDSVISQYKVYIRNVKYKNDYILIIRKMKINGNKYFLGVKVNDKYKTVLINAKNISFFNNVLFSFFQYKKVNYNIEKANILNTVFITIDLCPSSKTGFDKNLFLEIIKYAKKRNIEPNIAIAISYSFYKNHKSEFQEIMKWIKNKELNVVFINHSYEHFYDKNIKDNQKNFMLYNIKNAKEDILKNELFLLNMGILPSVFFRFPGLVYNNDIMEILQSLKLIPVGSSFWVAKKNENEVLKSGDIILLHGNKNEELGVKKFIKMLNNHELDNFKFGFINEIMNSK